MSRLIRSVFAVILLYFLSQLVPVPAPEILSRSESTATFTWLPASGFNLHSSEARGEKNKLNDRAIVSTGEVSAGPKTWLGSGPAPFIDYYGGSPPVTVSRSLKVGLVYEKKGEKTPAWRVWQQLLREGGIPFEAIPTEELSRLSPREIGRRFQALLLPDEIATQLPKPLLTKLKQYVLTASGKLLLVFDAGSRDEGGTIYARDPLADLTGVERHLSTGPVEGGWYIAADSPLRPYFDDGVIFDGRLGVYSLPPIVDQGYFTSVGMAEVLATDGPVQSHSSPEPTVRVAHRIHPGGGQVILINGRLARQKYVNNNDLIAKVPLKFFLREIAQVPYLVPAPRGKGTMVINLHVCSGAYFEDLDRLFYHGDLPTCFPLSIHITAGPDTNRLGDGTGVDVRNPKRGLPYVRLLANYGRIGSHGGWIHNYFALSYNKLSYETKKEFIDRNFAALQEVTGQKITEYAAPGGAHSEEINDFLANWGVRAAAYPVSFNAPPTHAWTRRGPEERFWHFGYTGTRYGTCFENMLAEKRPPAQIVQDTFRVIDEVLDRREIRLFYFHPISIARHPEMWRPIRRRLEEEVTRGRLIIRTMTDLADFLDRHQETSFTVGESKEGYQILARSPQNLAELTFALPLHGGHLEPVQGLELHEEGGWAYLTITPPVKAVAVLVRWKK